MPEPDKDTDILRPLRAEMSDSVELRWRLTEQGFVRLDVPGYEVVWNALEDLHAWCLGNAKWFYKKGCAEGYVAAAIDSAGDFDEGYEKGYRQGYDDSTKGDAPEFEIPY